MLVKNCEEFISIFFFVGGVSVWAADSSEVEKKNIRSSFDVIRYGLELHPDVLRAQAQVPIAEADKHEAKMWKSPELQGKIGRVHEVRPRGWQAEFALIQTIELGGKNKARVEKAQANLDLKRVLFKESKQKALFGVLTKLNRLRQISREHAEMEESIETFQKIIGTYKERSVLSDEDQISLEIFELAMQDYQIKKIRIEQEEKNEKGALAKVLGQQLPSSTKNIFLYAPQRWPALKARSLEKAIALQKAEVRKQVAIAERNAEKASEWPDLTVGPFIETSGEDYGDVATYGVVFSIPLPIYHSEVGQHARTRLEVRASEHSYELKKMELGQDYRTLKNQYVTGVKMLKTFHLEGVEQRHEKIEELFSKGRVSSALLIEAHRQIGALISSYHAYEMETMQALWKIYAMEGKLLNYAKSLTQKK